MVVRIEFYGIPRVRTGVPATQVEIVRPTTTLAHVVQELKQRFPEFADCVTDGQLNAQAVANVDGERFIRDSKTTIHDGETLLIMSADAGG